MNDHEARILVVEMDGIKYAVGDELITNRGQKGNITEIATCYEPNMPSLNVKAQFDNGEKRGFIQLDTKGYLVIGNRNIALGAAERQYEQAKATYEKCLALGKERITKNDNNNE